MLRGQELQRAQLEARLARLAEQRDELECDEVAAQSPSQATETELGKQRVRGWAPPKRPSPPRVRRTPRPPWSMLAPGTRSPRRWRAEVPWRANWSSGRSAPDPARCAWPSSPRGAPDLAREMASLQDAPLVLERQRAELEAQLAGIAHERDQLGGALASAEAALADAEARLDKAETERVEARESGARLEARLEHARAEHAQAQAALRARPRPTPNAPGELEELPTSPERLAELEAELARLALARERLGPVNLRAIDEAAELSAQDSRSAEPSRRSCPARSSGCGGPSRRSTARAENGYARHSPRSRSISRRCSCGCSVAAGRGCH